MYNLRKQMTILFIIQKQVEQEAAQLEGFENFKNKANEEMATDKEHVVLKKNLNS